MKAAIPAAGAGFGTDAREGPGRLRTADRKTRWRPEFLATKALPARLQGECGAVGLRSRDRHLVRRRFRHPARSEAATPTVTDRAAQESSDSAISHRGSG